MAASKDSMKEITNLCSICLEQYKLPVILPCSHSFCQTCLAAHIKSSCVDLDPPLGFPCPLCRVFIPAPGRIGQYSTDEWATKFPENKLLAVASVSPESTISCKPCEEDGEEVTANSWCIDCSEALCETCEKYHTKLRPSRHHVVVSLSDSLGTCKKPESLGNCETHDGRKLELFCENHLVPCCTICVTQEHRNCNHSLCQIEEVHANLVGPQKLEVLQSEVEKFCATLEQTIQEEKTNIDNIDDVADKCTKEISEFTQAIIQAVKCLEEKHLDEVSKLSKEAKSKLRQSVESFDQRLQYIRHWKDILMKSKGTSQINTVLSYTKMRSIFEDLRKLNYSKLGISIQNKFPETAQKLKNLSCLAEITLSEHWNNIKINQGELDFATAKVKTLNIFETNKTSIFGGDFLNNGKLLLATCTNPGKLILCNIDGVFTVLQEKYLPGYPFGVCVSRENEVLITLPYENKVLQLHSDSLEIKGTVSLKRKCYGVATSGNISIFGSWDSVAMFSDALEERRCTLSSEINSIYGVALDDENNVIYCSFSKHTVRKQDKAGNVLFSYNHEKLKSPYGLAVNRNGEIFVHGNKSNNIHILSKNGKLLRILEGINCPTWVKYQDDTNRLFVMEDGKKLKVLEFTQT